MILADGAQIGWDAKKKNWTISIHVGAEVIKRPTQKTVAHEAADDLLRSTVVQTAQDDGYNVRPEKVNIVR